MIDLVREYVTYKRKLGFSITIEAGMLMNFARFADSIAHAGPLTTELMLRWAQLPDKATQLYRARRLEVVRCFAKYRQLFDPKTEIPHRLLLGKAHRRRTPNIYNEADIVALMRGSRSLSAENRLRSYTMATIFGLLSCTGLRISEALNLERSDFDRNQGILTIRMTKFRKTRLVPLHQTAVKALIKYEKIRDRLVTTPKSNAFFLSSFGKRISPAMARYAFHSVETTINHRIQHGQYLPRLHDFRHAFACRRIKSWYENGLDIDKMILSLSTYLGHAKVTDTYWYITGTPELLQIAASLFQPLPNDKGGEQ